MKKMFFVLTLAACEAPPRITPPPETQNFHEVEQSNIDFYPDKAYIMHDDKRNTSCWVISGFHGVAVHCIPDWELTNHRWVNNMTDEKKTCKAIVHPSIAPGWGCCQCNTYNGDQRTNCKHCGHERCGAVPKVKHIPIEMPDGSISIRPVSVPTDPKKAN